MEEKTSIKAKMKRTLIIVLVALSTSTLVTLSCYVIMSIMGTGFNPYTWHPSIRWIGGTALIGIFIGIFVFYTKLLRDEHKE